MATYRLFKATYTSKGQTRESTRWYVEFRDHLLTVRRLAGFTSKTATDEFARNLVKLVEYHKATGGMADPSLTNWLAGLPQPMRNKLVEIGLLSAERVAAAKPLTDHVRDWSQSLAARGCTASHVGLVTARLNRILAGCGFTRFPEITATRVQAYLADLRKGNRSRPGQE